MTEKEWLEQQGFNESHPGLALLSVAVIAGTLYVMKSISDKKATDRGEKRRSWKEWLTSRKTVKSGFW